ncbi:MAG TPA: class I SAM-dependent methyltransferase [Chromatiaceae bacterium]|nr:class I SAM-dependent methyltransferase [Chromatiaceae bacterium]
MTSAPPSGTPSPPSSSLKDTYDALAAQYEAGRDQFDMTQIFNAFFRRLAEDIPAGGDLLDLGCGAGEPMARRFIEQGWRVTGVDLSPGMLGLAERRVPRMTRVLADMRDCDFPEGSFDAAILVYSLFHVPQADHPALFAKLFRWLRPGARLLFTYATKEYTGYDEFEGERVFLGRPLFYSHTTPLKLRAQVEAAGFACDSASYRDIGGETFLWVTVLRPAA